MSRRSTLLTAAVIVLGYLGLCLATQEWGFGRNARGDGPRYPYLLEDHYDRLAYQQRGRWLASGGRPYLDEMAEYPQLSVLLMGLPYLTFDHDVPRGEPFGAGERLRAVLRDAGLGPARIAQLVDRNGTLWNSAEHGRDPGPDPELARGIAASRPGVDQAQLEALIREYWEGVRERKEELKRNRDAYGDRHQILMAVFYLALIALAVSNLARLGYSSPWALLLCLPASLYFGFNRYDMVVTALVAAALWFQLRAGPERPHHAWGAGAMLGFAIMAKWFPLVLVPIFVSQNLARSRAAARASGTRWPLGRALVTGALAPAAAAGIVVCGFLAWTYLYRGGGWPAVLELPRWHREIRQPNHASLLWRLTEPRDWAWFPLAARDGLEQAFKVLQLAPAFLLALLPLRTNHALVLASLVATLCMMIFSEFFSPQWVIWVTALSLLVAPRWRRFLWLCVVLEVVIYLQLPVLYFSAFAAGGTQQTYYTSPVFDAFHSVSNARIILLFVYLGVALATLVAELRARDADAAQPLPSSAAYSTSASPRSSSA